MKGKRKCWICRKISEDENYNAQLKFSKLVMDISMCCECQSEVLNAVFEQEGTYYTIEHIALFFALQKRLNDVEIVKDGLKIANGQKTPFIADLAIPDAKLIIEVDGAHHFYNAERMMLDAKKTFRAKVQHDYSVVRISNVALCSPNRSENNQSMFVFVVESLVELINEAIDFHKQR